LIRRFTVTLFVALAAVSFGCTRSGSRAAAGPADALVASIRAEPRSFNRYATRDLSSDVVARLLHASLVRVDRTTDRVEPELADHWELLPDGVTYRVALRPGLRFSDGAPFSAADVEFSFHAVYSEGGSPLADSLEIGGRPLEVTAVDRDTVLIRFPSAFGPGLRLVDGVPILPRHRLASSLAAGRFLAAWGLSTAPSELAGMGPFILDRYDPGQRLVFNRNPHYWRRSADGGALPAVTRLVLDIVPDQDAELLRIAAGDLDFTQGEIRPADYAVLKRAEQAGRVDVADLGVGLDADLLWFNQTAAGAAAPRAQWLRQAGFRRAVLRAVDRRRFVDAVYFGDAVPASGIISPGNRAWHVDTPLAPYDPAAARSELESLGLSRADREGHLVDGAGAVVRFTLLTQKGNTSLERGAEFIRGSLQQIGVEVDVVALEVGSLVQRFTRGDYDAVYFRLLTTDTDPALNLDFWLSTGSAHVWNPEQRAAATSWERQVDDLMNAVATSPDQARRHESFAAVQRIFARELPAIPFAFPRLKLAMNRRVGGATPVPFRPPVLWNPAGLFIRPAAG